jgi:ribosomal-protein-alanine N-acetyltransferase
LVPRREPVKGGGRELLGVAGYVGPPTVDGAVELGYAIAEEHQRRGYATEAVQALVAAAFKTPSVAVIKAKTYATLMPSIGVLKKTGFSQVGSDPSRGLLWYERRRDG